MSQDHDDLDLGKPGAAEDPLAGVPSEPIDVSELDEGERLGGEGAELGNEAAPPPEGEFMEEPEESEVEAETPAAEPEPEAEAETPQEEPPPAAAEEPPAEEPQAAPAAEEPPPKAEGKKGTKKAKAKTEPRKYLVLRLDGEEITKPFSGPIKARNGDEAIKLAYKELAQSPDEEMELVPVPAGYWKPKKVKGRKKEDFAVEVN